MIQRILFFCLFKLIISCSFNSDNGFKIIDNEYSGIEFSNNLVENDSLNILDNEFFYNGAGVALATGMTTIATGSDLGGSLRNPAAWSNVVGIRSGPGRVPSVGGDLGWLNLSTDGPMGRTVDDVAMQLSVMAGDDPRSPLSLRESGAGYAGSLARDFKDVRIAWSKDLVGRPIDAENSRVTESVKYVFDDLGLFVEDDEPDFSTTDEIFQVLRAYSFAVKHEKHLQDHQQHLQHHHQSIALHKFV